MTNIPTEYIIAALLGLGGAAVWSIFCWFVQGLYFGFAQRVMRHADVMQAIFDEKHRPTSSQITAQTRIAALEERMDAVENPKRSHATACDDYYAATRVSCAPSLYSGGASGYFASGIDRNATGKPCPKPTKDLRPGDEVSVAVRVKTIGDGFIAVDGCPISYLTHDVLDALRTDNK